MFMKDNGYIFISHAHQDVNLIRRIRNHFEELGMEPIMFYLKCLSDEDEITDLLKREIKERNWFVYADSPAARESKWVKTERLEIKKYPEKRVFTIDLNSDINKQLTQIEHIVRQSKVYISYSHRDTEVFQKFRQAFLARDMQVLSDLNLTLGSDCTMQTENLVSEASHDGFVLLVISEESNKSRFVYNEIKLANAEHGKIIPVYLGDSVMPNQYISMLGDKQGFRIPYNPSDDDISTIVDGVLHKVQYYDSDFRNQFSYRSAQVIHLPETAVIDDLTFFECENLRKVYIPDSVTFISPNAFSDHMEVEVITGNKYVVNYCKEHGIRCSEEDRK